MAMTMNGEVTLPASKDVVWHKLNDPDVLKACIPGCEQLVKSDDTHFSAVVKVKLGPVKATFKGKVELVEINVKAGDAVTEGQVVAAVEAMKAKHDVKAPVSGQVQAVHATLGSEVSAGVPILTIA